MADFEAHLIRHLKENHLKAAAGPAGSRKSAAVPPAATNKDSLNIHVVERRLHVRVHNGHHFVHEPHIGLSAWLALPGVVSFNTQLALPLPSAPDGVCNRKQPAGL